jgi:hypothetical protein
MAKNVVKFPQGKLMEVAKEKGVNSKKELYERTGVDRKTIQAVNEGRPIKKSTVQRILDPIRVPLEHMTGAGSEPNPTGRSIHNLDLALADGKILKRLLDGLIIVWEAEEYIKWRVNLDRVDDALSSSLLDFKKKVGEYVEIKDGQSLEAQLSKIRVSEELEIIVQRIHEQGAKVFAGSWVKWRLHSEREHSGYDEYDYQYYWSYNCIIFAIEPKAKTSSRVEVHLGDVPPRRFNPPASVGRITVDFLEVWNRNEAHASRDDDDDIPF